MPCSVWDHYLVAYCLNCIKPAFILPIFDYCDEVWMLTTAVLSKRFHSRILQGLTVLLLSDVVSIRQFKYLKFCIFFVHDVCMTGLCLLKQSHDVKVGTSIAYMCHKFSLQLEKIVSIEVWLSGTVYPQICVALIVFQILRFHFKNWFVSIVFVSFVCD